MGRKRSAPASLKELRRLYVKRFPGTDMHHLVPVSRISKSMNGVEASTNRLLVFPYNREAHAAYHILFWNLRIDQVWAVLERVHHSIFSTCEDNIKQWWIEGCNLESGNYFLRKDFYQRRTERLNQLIETRHLQNVWLRAFGGEDLATAENLLKIMMLFMIFGHRMADQKELFDNGNLTDFFENTKPIDYRFWAFHTIFGEGGSTQGIKSKMAHILSKNRFYSL